MKARTVLFLLLAATPSFGQYSISGKVVDDSTKMPLEAASIYLPELRMGAVADSNGYYKISPVPAGKFLIEVLYVTYKTRSESILISEDLIINFSLSPEVIESQDVVISSNTSSDLQSSRPDLVLRKEDLLQNASTNIIDAIAQQPGISQISTGAGISKPVIRGLGYNRVIVANDGVRQEGQQWGDEHGIEIDEYAAAKIEVIKGPSSLMYGADGLGGVINILSPRPVTTGKISGNLLSNYQSNNHQQGYSAMLAGNNGKINWMNRLSSKTAGNYKNRYDGYVYNSGFRELDANGNIAANRRWGYTQLAYSVYDQILALPEGERDSLGRFTKEVPQADSAIAVPVGNPDLRGYRIGIPHQHVQHYKILLTNFIALGRSHINATLGYQQNRRREFGDVTEPTVPNLYFFLQTFNYTIRCQLPEKKGWLLALGTSGMQQFNMNKGKEFLIPAYRLGDAGIYSVIRKKIKAFSLNGGLRAEMRQIRATPLYLDSTGAKATSQTGEQKFSGFDVSYANIAGNAGVGFSPEGKKYTLRFNVSRGFRPPSIAELASNGRHEGAFRYERGDRRLKAETSLQLDAGFDYNTDHVSMQWDFFSNTINHYIFPERLRSRNGSDSVVSDQGISVPVYQYSSGRAELYGTEFSLDVHPHPLDWLHIENSFGFVRGLNLGNSDSSKNLPFIPPARWKSELKLKFKKAGESLSSFYFKIESDYNFAQHKFLAENSTERATPSYWLMNTGLGTDVLNSEGKTICSLYLSLNNIFNVAYQTHLSRLKYAPFNQATGRTGIYNMGRNFSIKVIVPLNIKG
ncbi:MAG: TonB-dependent receptor [Cytophagaceae bacterium]